MKVPKIEHHEPETAAPEERKEPLPTIGNLILGNRKKKGLKGKPIKIEVNTQVPNEEEKKKLLEEFEKEVKIPGSGKHKTKPPGRIPPHNPN